VLPESHLQFLRAFKPWFIFGDFFFVHAGANSHVPLTDRLEEDLLWIRDDFLTADAYLGKLVVHGHTPVAEPDIRSNRINIDTGAFATGRLTSLIIEGCEKYCLSLMTRLTVPFRLAAWIFIAILVLITIAPQSARLDSGVPHHLEYFASFFVAGALWYMGYYPRRLLLCLMLAVLFAGGWNYFRCWCRADMPG
jgi:hypothetical protein